MIFVSIYRISAERILLPSLSYTGSTAKSLKEAGGTVKVISLVPLLPSWNSSRPTIMPLQEASARYVPGGNGFSSVPESERATAFVLSVDLWYRSMTADSGAPAVVTVFIAAAASSPPTVSFACCRTQGRIFNSPSPCGWTYAVMATSYSPGNAWGSTSTRGTTFLFSPGGREKTASLKTRSTSGGVSAFNSTDISSSPGL